MAAAPRPRPRRAPGRTDRHAAPRRVRAPAAIRGDSRPRGRRGSARGRAAARRGSGRTTCERSSPRSVGSAPMLPLEAVPNFSEGRDSVLIGLIGSELAERARLLDIHTDSDPNRSGFTLVGADVEIVDALPAAVAVARARIDLRSHEGVHPRVGGADVGPVVPVRPGDMEGAPAGALTLAQRIGEELELPVFLYGELGGGRGPAFFRRGGPAELQRRIDGGEVA